MKGERGRRIKYDKNLPRAMYCYFRGYDDGGVPSFRKFAESVGATLEDVEKWREHKEFERAYRECSEIRRDYLIDNALSRRFDPSLVKYLLGAEYGETDDSSGELSVRLEVVR